MNEPVIAPAATARRHLTDVMNRAHGDNVPTIITRHGKQEVVVLGSDEYHHLRELAERVEDAWLNRLADEAESEGREGSLLLEEMTAAILARHA